VDRLLFLDTEATGLTGGAGTAAFLVGLGRLEPDGVRITQHFMRDLPDEPELLAAVARHVTPDTVLVTYNGRAFDWPLLAARFRLAGVACAEPVAHMDMLFLARRLWRRATGSARLAHLERAILGFERAHDLESGLVPAAYFEYVSRGRRDLMVRILEHNAHDVLSLAALTGVAAGLLIDGEAAGLRLDPYAKGRIAERRGDRAAASRCYREAAAAAAAAGGPRGHEARSLLERAARLAGAAGDHRGSADAWRELLDRTGGLHLAAYEELARISERRDGDAGAAIAWCRQGIATHARTLAAFAGPGGWLARIRERLERRLRRLVARQ
jgi:hypothetical protein